MTFRFVGTNESQLLTVEDGAVVGSQVLSEYGESVEMDAAAALNAIAGGCALVPESAFTTDRAAMQMLAAQMINEARETGEVKGVTDGNGE